MKNSLTIVAVLLCLLAQTSVLRAREPLSDVKESAFARRTSRLASARPIVQYTSHKRGNIILAVANNGTFGTFGQDIADPFTGERISSCVYPKGSDHVYLWVGAFWIGAIVGRDTLVSVGTEDFYVTEEFWPDEPPFGEFEYASIDYQSQFYSEKAFSEEDIYCEYTDTVTTPGIVSTDPYTSRRHKPLNIKVEQRTMAWSYEYANDFILFDYQIQNIGDQSLKKVYMGIWIDGDVWHVSRNGPQGWNDDIVGYLESYPAPEGCGFIDTVNIAFTADNDGDPEAGAWDYRSPRGVVGARVVRTPSDSLELSYNWWIINYGDPTRDFGPRRRATEFDPFIPLGTRLGTPEGDPNKYYVLSHKENDYDLVYTAVDQSNQGWFPPPEEAETFATGYDTRYLLSFGPFNIDPGQKLPISLAWVGGENFHNDPANADAHLINNYDPDAYYNGVNFSNLALNARWASWVYDNPGYVSEGGDSSYAGKFRVCVQDSVIASIDTTISLPDTLIDTTYRYTAADTFYYEGDGVPDFQGAGPPPAPLLRIVPQDGRLIVRWNGYVSETTKDPFIGEVDFEGYRVYFGLDDRRASLSLTASYDIEDYNRYRFTELPSGDLGWALEETPFSRDSLSAMFGIPDFDPFRYSASSPFSFGGELYYFEPQDFNQSDYRSPTGIHKVYPDAPLPPADTSLWTDEIITMDYGKPMPKYYEYEFVIDNIQSTVAYHVAVTAFDYGSPISGLPALETDPTNNMIVEYPQFPADSVEANLLDVYVYPNPYRGDAGYADQGYENRDRSLAPERARRIHFANLPHVCTISIFSLDGDLVRELKHNAPDGDPQSSHETWDLITRNTQAVKSGIYYWVVESPERSQMGKLVIIK